MSTQVHVCYALYDKKGTFSKYIGTSMTSLFENTKADVTVHLLHDSTLTDENRRLFVQTAKTYGQSICFYDMESAAGEVLQGVLKILPATVVTRFSQAALYRLLVGIVLPQTIDRIIYLDADTIVHMDIMELWRESVGAGGLAAVDEIAATQGDPAPQPLVASGEVERAAYFNSGVLLINLEYWREHPEFLTNGLQMLMTHPDCFCFDQDILNYSFAAQYAKLPGHYDVFVSSDRRRRNFLRPAIYHYAGAAMDPFDLNDAHNHLYASYFVKSPWCSGDFVMDLFRRMHGALDDSRVSTRSYFNLAAGKRRVFCGSRAMQPMVQSAFSLKASEEYKNIVDEKGKLSVVPLLNMMKGSRTSLFVIYIDIYDTLKPYLEQAGFKENQDFIDGMQLLKESEGGRCLWGGDLFDGL